MFSDNTFSPELKDRCIDEVQGLTVCRGVPVSDAVPLLRYDSFMTLSNRLDTSLRPHTTLDAHPQPHKNLVASSILATSLAFAPFKLLGVAGGLASRLNKKYFDKFGCVGVIDVWEVRRWCNIHQGDIFKAA